MREKYSNSPADELAGGKWLFAQGCNFSLGVVSLDGLPTSGEIEIAFAGRSNVGKSSLLNALTGRRGLARTSNPPGRTQELNFFKLAPNRDNGPWLVDMPGYGYARESKTKILAWNKLLNAYLRGRSNLRRAFVLVDSRHGLKPNDLEMFDQLDIAAVSYQVILTKSDKISGADQKAVLQDTADLLRKRPAAYPEIIQTSSETGMGVDILRKTIADLVDLSALGYKG